ncbi:discoidin domain-containing protein [Kitasatospora sp. NPDC057904]|uniref:discoidin domain-containing protein n=1 Tax=unclassified Kitasatospora TaxID=2633591 RepID=UPI0036D927BF
MSHVAFSNVPASRGYPLENLFDGDRLTYFRTDREVVRGDYVTVDLQTVEYVTNITLRFGGDLLNRYRPPAAELEVSADGETWKRVGGVSWDVLDAGASPPPGTALARYVRLRFTGASSNMVGVNSFRVEHEPGPHQPERVDVSVTLDQDLDFSEQVRCSPGSGNKVAAFHGPGGQQEDSGEEMSDRRALVLGPGERISDIASVERAEGEVTGWRSVRPFTLAAEQDDRVFQLLVAETGRKNAARVLGFLNCYNRGLLFSQMSDADGGWTEPQHLFDPFHSVRLAHGEQVGSVLHALRERADDQGLELVLAFLRDDFEDGRPRCSALDVSGLGIVSDDYDLIPLLDGRCLLLAAADRTLKSWTIERDGPNSAPRLVEEEPFSSADWDVHSVMGGFETGYDTDAARLLYTDVDSALWTCTYEYDPESGSGLRFYGKELLNGGGESLLNGNGNKVEAVFHQPDLDDGRAVYSLGTSADDAPGTQVWVSRHLVPSGEGRPPEEWTRPVPLRSGSIRMSVADTDHSSYFLWDGDGGNLRLHHQDFRTGLWQQSRVAVAGQDATEVARYRLAATVVDAAGAPVPDFPVALAVPADGPACEAVVQGRTRWVTGKAAPVWTDGLGKVTVSVAPEGLVAPEFRLEVPGLSDDVPLKPAEEVQQYLAGEKDDLNPTNPGGPLPRFDEQGSALKTLAPDLSDEQAAQAAQCIRYAMLGSDAPCEAFEVNLVRGTDGTIVPVLTPHTLDSLNEARRAAGVAAPGQAQSWLRRMAGDLWEGIASGVLVVRTFLVDTVNKVIDIVAAAGEEIIRLAGVAWNGILGLGRLAESVVAGIGVAVTAAVDWLKAVFDLDHVRNTQKALQEALTRSFASLQTAIAYYGRLGDEWFEEQEAEIRQSFAEAREKWGDKSVGEPEPTDEVGPGERGIGSDTHANWMAEKTESHRPETPLLRLPEDILREFAEKITEAVGDIAGGIVDAFDALADAFTSPEGFGALTVTALLDALEQIVTAAFRAGAATMRAVLSLLSYLVEQLDLYLKAPLYLPWPLDKVWTWAAGPGLSPSIGALVSLVAAFPATIGYKIAVGDPSRQPFPGGRLVAPARAGRQGALGSPESGIVLGVLQIADALVSSGCDAYEVKQTWLDPTDPGPAMKVGLAELGYYMPQFGLLLAAEWGSEDAWDQGMLAFDLVTTALSLGSRTIKRCTVGALDWAASLAETIAGLVSCGCSVKLLLAAESDDATYLAWAGVVGAIPDIFGHLTSVAGSLPGPKGGVVLAGKAGINVLSSVAEGALSISGYNARLAT